MKVSGDYQRFLTATNTTHALRHTPLLISEIRGGAGFGATPRIAYDNAYVIQLRLLECRQCSYFLSGQPLALQDRRAGVLQFLDLRLDPSALILDPFHVMHLYVPRCALSQVAEELGGRGLDSLRFEHGAGYRDETIGNLLLALRPFVARPQEASSMLIENIVQGLYSQLFSRFGNMAEARRVFRGGLAAWQVQRVRDLIESSLEQDIPLARLAGECGLSVRHFSRAFAQSFGMPAHRYLMTRRVELALELLKVKSLSIPEIALKCGFVDQSHLTRVFASHTGSNPGHWRRARHGSQDA